MKRTFSLILVLFLLIIPLSQASSPIDVGICESDLATADAKVQTCINDCTVQNQASIDAYNSKKAELDGIFNNPIDNCEGYPECAATCKAQSADFVPEGDDPNIGNIVAPIGNAMACLKNTCPDAIAACEAKKAQLEQEIKNDLYYSYKCVCESCILPACRYQKLSSCSEMTKTCDDARNFAFGAAYSNSKKSWIGCNSSKAIAAKLTKMAIAGSNNKKTETPKIENPPVKKIETPPQKTINKKNNLNSVQQKNKQKTQQKLQEIKNKQESEVIEINTPEGKKEIILKNPDNKKLDFFDKQFYKKKKKIESDIVDETFGNIPGLGLWKDYVKKFIDDQKSDDTKTKQTQADLGIGKNSAKQFNLMDGTGDKELGLSPAKNAIPSTPLTKPYEFIFTQLGNGIKKTMAHGYNSEYNSVLEQAKELRAVGSSWSQTIKQTTILVGQETEGKRWVQTLNAQSKKDYQSQSARINAYILQMKENGELK